MTQRIGLLFHDSKNWTFFCTTQRIELFSVSLKEVNFSPIDSKKWTLLNYHSKNWIFFHDSKNWTTLLFWTWLKDVFLKMTHFWLRTILLIWSLELNLFFFFNSKDWPFSKFYPKDWTLLIWPKGFFLIWLKESNTFFEYDSKNWTLFQKKSQTIELFKMTQRIEPFFQCDSKSWTFFSVTQRVEPFLKKM